MFGGKNKIGGLGVFLGLAALGGFDPSPKPEPRRQYRSRLGKGDLYRFLEDGKIVFRKGKDVVYECVAKDDKEASAKFKAWKMVEEED